jgi:hypothetical protein
MLRPMLVLLAVTLAQRALADAQRERRAYCPFPRYGD